MRLPCERRLPDDEYQLRYNDPEGQILPLPWLGGCVLCLWFAAGAAVVVTVMEWNVPVGRRVLVAFTPDTVTELPAVAERFPPAAESAVEAETEDFDLLDVLSGAARALWLLALIAVEGGFLLRLGRSH